MKPGLQKPKNPRKGVYPLPEFTREQLVRLAVILHSMLALESWVIAMGLPIYSKKRDNLTSMPTTFLRLDTCMAILKKKGNNIDHIILVAYAVACGCPLDDAHSYLRALDSIKIHGSRH